MSKSKSAATRPATKKATTQRATKRVASGPASAPRPTLRQRASPAPTAVRFFLADDVRQEIQGKVTMVGLYADNIVVAEMPPDHRNPSVRVPAAIPRVAILASVSIAQGEHRYRMELDRSSVTRQKIDAKTATLISERPGESINLIMRLAPLLFVRFGTVKVLLYVDDQPYPFDFEIRRRDKPQ
jgi:hypothetical protein